MAMKILEKENGRLKHWNKLLKSKLESQQKCCLDLEKERDFLVSEFKHLEKELEVVNNKNSKYIITLRC